MCRAGVCVRVLEGDGVRAHDCVCVRVCVCVFCAKIYTHRLFPFDIYVHIENLRQQGRTWSLRQNLDGHMQTSHP